MHANSKSQINKIILLVKPFLITNLLLFPIAKMQVVLMVPCREFTNKIEELYKNPPIFDL